MLGGVSYPNNSVVQFDSIYYTPDHCHSLLCTTDRIPCCSDSQRGNWYHVQSNGSFINVVSTLMIADYYQSRENDGTLRLIRQGNIIQSTDSFYCCQLPDASLFVQTLCVTIGMPSCPFQHMCHVMHQCIKFQKLLYTSCQFSWCVAVTGRFDILQQQCNRATRVV